MKWEDFKKYVEDSNKHQNAVKTGIQCPICEKYIYRKLTIVTLDPPRFQYFCECGWEGQAREGGRHGKTHIFR